MTNKIAAAPVLAIDIGSTSLRLGLFHVDGDQVGSAVIVRYRPRRVVRAGRIDPKALLRAVLAGLGEVSADGVSIISTSVVWQTVLAVDASGEPLGDALTWESGPVPGRPARVVDLAATGAYDHPSFPAYHLDELLELRPARLCDLGGWLLGRLTGRACGWSEAIASGSGLWDQRRRTWTAAVPDRAGRLLGEPWAEPVTVAEGGLLAGTHLARAYVLPPIGDGFAVNVGLGAHATDRPVAVTFGTSGSVRRIHHRTPPVVQGLWRFRLGERAWASGGAITSAGNVLEWAADVFGPGERVAQWLISAADLPDVVADADVFGRRGPDYPAAATGGLRGLRPGTTRRDLLHALQIDVFRNFAQLHELLGRPGPVVAAGGAMTNDPGLFGVLAAALGRPVLRTDCAEPALRGAGLLGAVTVAGARNPLDDVVDVLHGGRFAAPPAIKTYQPDEELEGELRLRWRSAT